MKPRTATTWLLAAAIGAAAFTGARAVEQRAQTPTTIAIRNVTVIVGDATAPRAQMTVLVNGERIAAVGPTADVTIPAAARVIDGTNKFLMPGLIDLHAHVSKARASSLGLFIANGVTTVRDMGGDLPELLQWRRQIDAGTRVGPRMVIAGYYLESARNIERMRKDPPEARVEPFERIRIGVGTPEEARRAVARLAGLGVDFLKIRTVQNEPTYRALNDAAQAHGLKLVGHVSGLSPSLVLDAGQDGIDHFFYPSMEGPREERMAVWRKFAERGVPIVPTLVTGFKATFPTVDQLRAVVEDEEGRIEPRRRYVSRFMLLDWREQLAEASAERSAMLRKVYDETIRRDLREMREAGMEILAGSDVAVLNIFPGSSLHEELALLVQEVGLTPAEAIASATSRSARFLALDNSIGTVSRGKIADLLLLDADPSADIANTKRIASVFVRGRVFDAAGLERVRDAVRNAPDRKTDDWGRTRTKK